MTGFLGILLSLTLLMALAYRGMSVILLAPLLALLAVALDGSTPVLASYTQVFMPSMAEFTLKYFPLFLLGAIFGKLMEDSGAAASIARSVVRLIGERRAILAVVLSCAILTYGGISLFVVAFTVYPIAAALFRQARVPKRLIPGSIALGAFTFSMTCLPGTPQIQNLIPMPYFQTTAFAAPVLGTIGGAIIFILGMAWLVRRERAAAARGEGYGTGHTQEATPTETPPLPPLTLALAPLVLVISLNYALTEYLIPRWDTAYLAQAAFGSTDIGKLRGTWAMILAVAAAVAMTLACHFRTLKNINGSMTQGVMGSLLPTFNTASEFGYGATIASLPAFGLIKNAVLNIAPGNPLVSEAVAINAMAGITGSASGGLSIALKALGDDYHRAALDKGIDPELMHRVAVMSCGGLDTLPHNGAVITLLVICGLTHRQSYLDIGVVSLVIPLIATSTVILLGTLFGSM